MQNNNCILSVVLLTASLICVNPAAFAQTAKQAVAIPQVSDGWQFSITPYVWATGMSGSLGYGGNQIASTSIGSSSVFQALKFGGMVGAEVHKGNFGFSMDLMYASLGNNGSRAPDNYVDLGSTTSVTQGVYTLAGTYTLFNSKNVYLDALAGARIFSLSSTTNFSVNGFQVGYSQSSNTTTVDPIIGLKGRIRIADSDYFIPFYADVGGGGGSTQVTSQGFVGVGRGFEWGDVQIGVKDLYYSQKNNNVTTNLNFLGFAGGVTFRF
jgi:hypothetical protein